ncbi:hypothetical protein PBT90_04080 [Algoriphagus halophytocola]|uniref:Uncharacterized protein n=1 Tax=Algoriphagus halophytocola TaxID=2991499 RepID=A0ABY6MJJ8_9BACT|nr:MULTISPECIES: hypothetical protein [unclassified Algoriphagus]UZD22597.1 hypothetical protein OM944_18340 [Algoriphagus sp. TR-M5]WBL43863.1 hypothetical protein PBT90_04080 [Algoriphagus sp. TR-M9]
MLHPMIVTATGFPTFLLGKKKDEVDKGTTRKTPGNSEGAKPPSKKDYNEIERKNDNEKDIQEETVDNEERDKNRK